VYPSSSKLPGQFKKDLAEKSEKIFNDIDELTYKISSNSILYENAAIYEASGHTENFAHLFFRDGVLSLNFSKGIDQAELGRFIDLLAKMMRTIYIDNDIVTLLWEEDFHYISYELIDDDLEIETVEYTMDNFRSDNTLGDEDIKALYRDESEITFDESDISDDAKQVESSLQSAAYSNMSPDSLEFLTHISELTHEEKAQIAELLTDDAKFDSTEYLLTIIFEILGMEKEIPGYVEVLKYIGKVRDNFIQLGNFAGLANLLKKMRELLTALSKLETKRAEKIEGFFLDCASKEKIELLTESINSFRDADHESMISYLKQLPWAAIDPLLYSLGELNEFKARRAVCSVLAELGKEQVDIIARGLDDERWFVVRNVIMVLGEIGNPKIINFLKKTIRHPDFRVRKETLKAAARLDMNERDDFLILSLSDPDIKIQLFSLDNIVKTKCRRAFKAIEHIIKDKKFRDRTPEQIRKFLETYAAIGQDDALPFLASLTKKKLFFSSGKMDRINFIAIDSIAKIKTNEAKSILMKIAKRKNKKFASAALRAAGKRK
ncbi:MAG: HEAT repeat domain-containing protein, partial [candidate division Zixibacteria bacterium]|nr:HEAT repeat domain-containing protein [candidate division Zixibacteria bacterium]